MVHDRALLRVPRLLEDVAGALTVALANAQMQGELRVRVAAVDASRRRLATAAEAERRHFGERLRGSAEWHLDAAEQGAGRGGRPRRAARDGAARRAGGHPDAGRGAASGRARARRAGRRARGAWRRGRRSPWTSWRVPAGFPLRSRVRRGSSARRRSPTSPSTARLLRAVVRAARRDGVVRVEISDDGRGGADPARGSGLRGMAERVEALGGRLWVADRPGGGTVVAAELPAR